MVTFGLIAYALALVSEGVHSLVEEASAFGGAGVFVVILFALFTSIGKSKSAIAALLGGILSWVAGHHFLDLATPYLISMAVALAAYLLVAITEHFAFKSINNDPSTCSNRSKA